MTGNAEPFFVFAVVGVKHVEALTVPMRYLRHCTDQDIVVVQSRSSVMGDATAVLEVETPAGLDDHQASIWLKTSLPQTLARHGYSNRQFCYLDSDVLALSPEIDDIFSYQTGAVSFAADHATIDMFSHWAVNCGCRSYSCSHLREALFCDYGVDVHDVGWTMWNGGIFVADIRSMAFFDAWHSFTLASFKSSYWRTRDQGTLAAAVWHQGLQSQKLMPRKFNYVLDCLWGLEDARRKQAEIRDLAPWPDFELRKEIERGDLACLHLVNQGIGRSGWRPWDAVANFCRAH